MTNRQKYIVDTTLSDGEQSPGHYSREKVTIAKSLDTLGVSGSKQYPGHGQRMPGL